MISELHESPESQARQADARLVRSKNMGGGFGPSLARLAVPGVPGLDLEKLAERPTSSRKPRMHVASVFYPTGPIGGEPK
jgi:hypothetical protein